MFDMLPPSSAMKIEAVHYSQASLMVKQTAQHHVTEGVNFLGGLAVRYMWEYLAQTTVKLISE
jgi:hypothetical protein